MCVGQVGIGGSGDLSISVVPEERTKRSKEELRELWRKAILQQILLQRMEMENQKLQGELEGIEMHKHNTISLHTIFILQFIHMFINKSLL